MHHGTPDQIPATGLPLACELPTPELQRRKAGLLATVRDQADHIAPIAGGLRLRFPDSPSVLADVLELVRLESACCRFLQFRLAIGPAGTPVALEVTGPPGTEAFLDNLGWKATSAL